MRSALSGSNVSAVIAKNVFHQLFSAVDTASFNVIYWDGTSEQFGNDPPKFTIRIHSRQILDKLTEDLEVGLGEAYMDGLFDVEGDIADVAEAATNVLLRRNSVDGGSLMRLAGRIAYSVQRRSKHKQRQDIEHHYDLGNEFFDLWLDESRTYSCAYFKSPDDTIDVAQRQKIDHSLKKLRLEPGERLLDIGCGWGALITRAAKNHQVYASGITLSREQRAYVCQKIESLGLDEFVDVQLIDYHSLASHRPQFDKIVSIGMIEHVGKSHLDEFVADVAAMLRPGGLALLHFITSPQVGSFSAWLDRYIFPGAYLPTIAEMTGHLAAHNLRVLDIENLRPHYEMTLDRWSERFEQHVPRIREMYGERFVRMWRLYLRGCAASFRTGTVGVHQILASNGVPSKLPLTRDDLYQ